MVIAGWLWRASATPLLLQVSLKRRLEVGRSTQGWLVTLGAPAPALYFYSNSGDDQVSGLGALIPLDTPCAVKQRMKSVASIQKITKAMKMVAASKMRSAQLATEKSRGIVAPFVKLLGDLPDVDVAKNITVPVTTDRGLCGGINTTVCKYARATVKTLAGGAPAGLVLEMDGF